MVSGSQMDISEAPGAKIAAVALTRRRGRSGGRAGPWGPVFPHFPPLVIWALGPPLGPWGPYTAPDQPTLVGQYVNYVTLGPPQTVTG